MEVMNKRGEEGKDVPPGNSQGSRNAHGVPGEHVVLIFLLCKIFLTATWGGITPLLKVLLRFVLYAQTGA
jgi:hypothetical protein